MYKNLEGCIGPKIHGKALVANKTGQWRYRIGDYRLICNINNNECIILAITVGHKKNIKEDLKPLLSSHKI